MFSPDNSPSPHDGPEKDDGASLPPRPAPSRATHAPSRVRLLAPDIAETERFANAAGIVVRRDILSHIVRSAVEQTPADLRFLVPDGDDDRSFSVRENRLAVIEGRTILSFISFSWLPFPDWSALESGGKPPVGETTATLDIELDDQTNRFTAGITWERDRWPADAVSAKQRWQVVDTMAKQFGVAPVPEVFPSSIAAHSGSSERELRFGRFAISLTPIVEVPAIYGELTPEVFDKIAQEHLAKGGGESNAEDFPYNLTIQEPSTRRLREICELGGLPLSNQLVRHLQNHVRGVNPFHSSAYEGLVRSGRSVLLSSRRGYVCDGDDLTPLTAISLEDSQGPYGAFSLILSPIALNDECVADAIDVTLEWKPKPEGTKELPWNLICKAAGYPG